MFKVQRGQSKGCCMGMAGPFKLVGDAEQWKFCSLMHAALCSRCRYPMYICTARPKRCALTCLIEMSMISGAAGVQPNIFNCTELSWEYHSDTNLLRRPLTGHPERLEPYQVLKIDAKVQAGEPWTALLALAVPAYMHVLCYEISKQKMNVCDIVSLAATVRCLCTHL